MVVLLICLGIAAIAVVGILLLRFFSNPDNYR